MARWRLTQPHYINVPGTEWEYKETDRGSGKQGRKVYTVPLHMHPDAQSDWNYPGEIIVCHQGKGLRADIVFLGDPTPDMEPLDDEARVISEKLAPSWKHPIEALPGTFSQSLIGEFERQIANVMAKRASEAVNLPTNNVTPEKFAELQEQVAALMKQNAALLEKTTKRV